MSFITGIYERVFDVLVSPKRVPMRYIVITALTSYVLQIGAIVLGYPLYLIALYTLLPWIPVFFFESLWKVEHYTWIAGFFIIVILQTGHMGEHLTQVAQLGAFNGTLACPPTIDNQEHAQLAIDAGLRSADDAPTGFSTSWVVKPDKSTGLPLLDENGKEIVGPASCGVFGQLDIEIVHLVWEVIGWIATLVLLIKWPRNIWLWIALLAVSVHSVEHLFISWIFFVETDALYTGFKQLWATTADGGSITSHPVGLEPKTLTFYAAGGKNGVMAQGGLVDTLVQGLSSFLPTRPWLHFWYNTFVFIPTVIAFIVQLRQLYDEYLATALPSLSEEELSWVTPKLTHETFKSGESIIIEGDRADKLYILTKGTVDAIQQQSDGSELIINQIQTGQYFGEMGLVEGTPRTATIRAKTDVEVMSLGRAYFENLISNSEKSEVEIRRLISERRTSKVTNGVDKENDT